jgi:hypothetical protein
MSLSMRLTEYRASALALVTLVIGCDSAPAHAPPQSSGDLGKSTPAAATTKPGARPDVAGPSPSMTPLKD